MFRNALTVIAVLMALGALYRVGLLPRSSEAPTGREGGTISDATPPVARPGSPAPAPSRTPARVTRSVLTPDIASLPDGGPEPTPSPPTPTPLPRPDIEQSASHPFPESSILRWAEETTERMRELFGEESLRDPEDKIANPDFWRVALPSRIEVIPESGYVMHMRIVYAGRTQYGEEEDELRATFRNREGRWQLEEIRCQNWTGYY